MNKKKVSPRETIMLVFLLVLVIGVAYYMGFYTPLQQELSALASQASTTDSQIASATSRLTSMNAMQEELDAIHAMPEDEVTEIAPYDNKEVVLNLLNGILANTEYSLNFSEPAIQENGTVRRNVSMSYSCDTYEAAKQILENLANCQWRCLISNLSVSGSGDVMDGPVSVSATITFFESTNLR